MQRFALLTIGKPKEEWVRDATDLYAQRIRHFAQIEMLELAPSRGKTAEQQRAEESERLLAMISKAEGEVWVLDETGEGMMSQSFAAKVSKARDEGTPIVFVLGGAYGFTDAVRKAGRRVIRLSDMTLPHELARVVFLEQLYRALEINRGSGYHH